MRSLTLSIGAAFVFGLAVVAFADPQAPGTETAPAAEAAPATQAAEPGAGAQPGAGEAASDQAAMRPAQADSAQAASSAQAEAKPARHAVSLGAVGYDAQGRPGRIHQVASGDTLWDISDAYLGTPWVWPSIWSDNQTVTNPHLIRPGDHLWITPHEMRRVSAEEAKDLLAGQPGEGVDPASFEDGMGSHDGTPARSYRYTEVQSAGFVTTAEFKGSATIVDSSVERVWLADSDPVIIGFGKGEVEVGDRFEVFRPGDRVIDPGTGEVSGYATEVLGWLEVDEVHDQTATATIRLARSEIRRGDHLLPRPVTNPDIEVSERPEVEGQIVHTPSDRIHMGSTDVVYLNRGTNDGLAMGSPLEVYRPLGTGLDKVRGDERQLPDQVIAKLVVVSARPETAAAVVTHTTHELTRGDRFRGSNTLGWQAARSAARSE
jgi:hypothetical protein